MGVYQRRYSNGQTRWYARVQHDGLRITGTYHHLKWMAQEDEAAMQRAIGLTTTCSNAAIPQ